MNRKNATYRFLLMQCWVNIDTSTGLFSEIVLILAADIKRKAAKIKKKQKERRYHFIQKIISAGMS